MLPRSTIISLHRYSPIVVSSSVSIGCLPYFSQLYHNPRLVTLLEKIIVGDSNDSDVSDEKRSDTIIDLIDPFMVSVCVFWVDRLDASQLHRFSTASRSAQHGGMAKDSSKHEVEDSVRATSEV